MMRQLSTLRCEEMETTDRRARHDGFKLLPQGVDRLKPLPNNRDVLDVAIEQVHVGHTPPESLRESLVSLSSAGERGED